MTWTQFLLILAVAAIVIAIYGFGWCDGRDSIRKEMKRWRHIR